MFDIVNDKGKTLARFWALSKAVAAVGNHSTAFRIKDRHPTSCTTSMAKCADAQDKWRSGAT